MQFSSIRRRGRTLAVAVALTGVVTLSAALPITHTAHAAPAIGDTAATDGADDVPLMATHINCPLLGPSQFIDSWGAARSGGRRHEGVDMIADRGTPIVAVRTGEAQFKQSGLGGNAIWLTTASGDRYYYAHLDRFEGSSRSVVRGEVIGYVGSTGNARGPHLHFETMPNGTSENPFGMVFAACVAPPTNVTWEGFSALQRAGQWAGADEAAAISARHR